MTDENARMRGANNALSQAPIDGDLSSHKLYAADYERGMTDGAALVAKMREKNMSFLLGWEVKKMEGIWEYGRRLRTRRAGRRVSCRHECIILSIFRNR
jgi:hypothetical protein